MLDAGHSGELQEAKIDCDPLDLVERWYQGYHRLLIFFGTAAATLLLFPGAKLIDLADRPGTQAALVANRTLITVLFVVLAICLVLILFSVVFTYNWYVTALSNALHHSKKKITFLGDPFRYRSNMGSTEAWGQLSFYAGLFAGLSLGAAALIEAWLILRLVGAVSP